MRLNGYFIIVLYIAFLRINQIWAIENDYIINVANKCKLPNLQAHSEEVKNIFQQQEYFPCTDKSLLTYTTVTNNFATLHINQSARHEYYDINEQLDCCYQYVTRNGSNYFPDVGIRISKCRNFIGSTILKKHPILVKCFRNATTVYENAHNPITISHKLKEKIQTKQNTPKPISVLFVVVDSVSRLNLIRTMPKTRNFLLNNDFIEMKGYNKIDDNTFPNFNALLTGFNLKQSRNICKPFQIRKLDECPMIWYDYRKLGYITAYAEDWTAIGTFNYNLKGFSEPPTDYYFKPYLEATETLTIQSQDTMPHCTGPESAGERILNLASDFATTFLDVPTFGIFWMNTFSHNHINTPSGMDDTIQNFFINLKHKGVLNESVVIFLSDHGIRFGDIRQTTTGWFEERLPMNLISLPPWFKKQFPVESSFLYGNAEKLTTTFDLHKTLQHFLVLSGKNYTETRCKGSDNCQSLLTNIPIDRNCADAGIPKQWCTCYGNFQTLDLESKSVSQAANLIIQDIEYKNQNFVRYKVENVTKATISEVFDGVKYMIITIETLPIGNYLGMFTVKKNNVQKIQVIKIY